MRVITYLFGIAFWVIERLGGRTFPLLRAASMITCQLLAGIIDVTAGTTRSGNHAISAKIAFICLK
jgi:hypothetical protein